MHCTKSTRSNTRFGAIIQSPTTLEDDDFCPKQSHSLFHSPFPSAFILQHCTLHMSTSLLQWSCFKVAPSQPTIVLFCQRQNQRQTCGQQNSTRNLCVKSQTTGDACLGHSSFVLPRLTAGVMRFGPFASWNQFSKIAFALCWFRTEYDFGRYCLVTIQVSRQVVMFKPRELLAVDWTKLLIYTIIRALCSCVFRVRERLGNVIRQHCRRFDVECAFLGKTWKFIPRK